MKQSDKPADLNGGSILNRMAEAGVYKDDVSIPATLNIFILAASSGDPQSKHEAQASMSTKALLQPVLTSLKKS